MRFRFARVVATLLMSGSLLAGPAPAQAKVVQDNARTSDNRIAFEYDEASGTITSHTSTRRPQTDPNVDFRVLVHETTDGGPGLLGKLKLRLNGDEHTVFDGWLCLAIEDGDGDPAFTEHRPVSIHLRPQPGMRRAVLRFRFDLPSGDYTAVGDFEPSD